VMTLGPQNAPKEHARRLYGCLRAFDKTPVRRIFAQGPAETGAGRAVINRMKKAAGGNIKDLGETVVLGLTGRSGGGKTTACAFFDELGAHVINADEVYRKLTEIHGGLRQALALRFGAVFLPDGSLNRAMLSGLVFSDRQALSDLNAIAHKYVADEIRRLMLSEKIGGVPLIVVDAPQLFESGFEKYCDFTAAVLSEEDRAVSRLTARDGADEARIRARLQSQHDDGFFREKCDFIIENNSTAAALKEKIRALYGRLLRDGGKTNER